MKTFKRIIRNIIEILGQTLVITGEVGLILLGLSYLWMINKITFLAVFIAMGIVYIIEKIKE